MDEILKRRSQTELRLTELRRRLVDAEGLCSGKACVYATGSTGRCEAGSTSDLDLFIVGEKSREVGRSGVQGSMLTRLDEICIKADLIEATRQLGIPDFDGDGEYLTHFSVHQFTCTLGKPEDDAQNTFTARLLLLLESRPLLGADVYLEVIEEVIGAYWGDYEDHRTDFIPSFLSNDILRLWRTFCVNYEARTERQPEEKNAKRKLKNYKLKHSRLLTCFSALLYLLAVHRLRATVSPRDALSMVQLTPTERIEWLLAQETLKDAHPALREIVQLYERFLRLTGAGDIELTRQFLNRDVSREHLVAASGFGDKVYEALTRIGAESRYHRLLVV